MPLHGCGNTRCTAALKDDQFAPVAVLGIDPDEGVCVLVAGSGLPELSVIVELRKTDDAVEFTSQPLPLPFEHGLAPVNGARNRDGFRSRVLPSPFSRKNALSHKAAVLLFIPCAAIFTEKPALPHKSHKGIKVVENSTIFRSLDPLVRLVR